MNEACRFPKRAGARRRWLLPYAAALLALLCCGCAAVEAPEPAGPLDLSGQALTPAEYAAQQAAQPGRVILWDVPIGDASFPSEAESLTLPALREAELPLLDYFPNLRALDASGSDCYAALLAYAQAHPDCEVRYTVPLGSVTVTNSDTEAVLGADADLAALPPLLAYLPALEALDLHAAAPERAEMDALLAACPERTFLWQVPAFGLAFENTATEIDLSNVPVESPAAVEALLPYFPALERLILCDTGLTNEQMETLVNAHPDIRFVWTVYFNKWSLRTDATAFSTKNGSKKDQSNAQARWRLDDEEVQVLKYCTDLVALDLGHNEISDLSFLAGMKDLQIIILADNKIADISVFENLQSLVYAELFMNRIEDLTALGTIAGLVDLNLCHNYVTDPTPLYNCKKLERLWISSTRIKRKQWPEIQAALPDCHCVFDLFWSTGAGWREHERYFWMHAFFYPEEALPSPSPAQETVTP